jgi:lysophospholipase L1-like esterase
VTTPAAARRVWTRYVAIGDSFTEGLSDPDPEVPDRFVGWADRLARRLDAAAAAEHLPFGYANLAVRGRKLDDVVGRQLDTALSMQPDLVSMVGGGNDLLRPSVDLDALAERLEEAVVRLRATGADVLLATPTDTRDAGLFKALRGRHAVHTANLFTIAQRHGCSVLNLWGMAALRDWRMWAEDRIHLTSEGHRRVSLAALEALGHRVEDPDWRVPLPAADRASRREELRGHAEWARTHAAPWVQRRLRGTSSGDRLDAKRPTLTHFRDPESEPPHHALPDA